VRLIWLKTEAAIARAKLFDSLNDRTARFFVLQTGSSPDTRQATEMDEIQMLSVAEAAHVRPNFFHRRLSLKRDQPIDAEGRVIEITSARAISEAPVPIELSKQKIAHELGGISEDFRREPSHLDHL
jgi:hypothetical protein